MARAFFVALVAALVLLSASTNGLNIGSYNLAPDDGEFDLSVLLAVPDSILPSFAAGFRNQAKLFNDTKRYQAIANQILFDAPDAFVFQASLSLYEQSPATVFPVTKLTLDSVSLVLQAVQAGGLSYTIVQDGLDFDITAQALGAQLDTPDKVRFKYRSGVAVLTSLLPLVITKSAGTYVHQDSAVPFSTLVGPVYVSSGWQRIKFFADATPWIISTVSLSETTATGKAQANELLALAANDEYSILAGDYNAPADILLSNSVSVVLLAGYVDAGETANDLTITCCFNVGSNTGFDAVRDNLILYKTPAVRLSNYHVNIDLGLFLPYPGFPTETLSVNVIFTPLGSQDANQAQPVVLPGKPNPPPPPFIKRLSESSEPVVVVDVAYTRVTQDANPPSIAGAFSGADVVAVEPQLPVASTTDQAAYLPGAFVNQVRPLTHSVSADASTTAVCMALLMSVVVLAVAQMF